MPVAQGNGLTAADLVNLNYSILVPFNNTEATGGDSLHYDLNVFYEVSPNSSMRL